MFDSVSHIEKSMLIESYSSLSSITASRSDEQWIALLSGSAIHRYRFNDCTNHPLLSILRFGFIDNLLDRAIEHDINISSTEMALGIQLLIDAVLIRMYVYKHRKERISRYITGTWWLMLIVKSIF